MKIILTTPTPHIIKKIWSQNRPYNEGSYGVKIPWNKGTFTENCGAQTDFYDIRTPTFMAYEPPPCMPHEPLFYWGWGWSLTCWNRIGRAESQHLDSQPCRCIVFGGGGGSSLVMSLWSMMKTTTNWWSRKSKDWFLRCRSDSWVVAGVAGNIRHRCPGYQFHLPPKIRLHKRLRCSFP